MKLSVPAIGHSSLLSIFHSRFVLSMMSGAFLFACGGAEKYNNAEPFSDLGVISSGATHVMDGGVADTAMATDIGSSSTGNSQNCSSLRWGVNIHEGIEDLDKDGIVDVDAEMLAEIMKSRHLTTARMDLWANDKNYLKKFNSVVKTLASNNSGITVQAVLFNRYSKGQKIWLNPKPIDPDKLDLTAIENDSYMQTMPVILATEGLVHDYELQNEVSLYDDIRSPGTDGRNERDFDTAWARVHAANLHGMARAINERKKMGVSLRIILGTTDRSFGFLQYMKDVAKVDFDVVGYHIYPWYSHELLNEDSSFFGDGGPLGQLAKFGKPIHINEFNCGETYSGHEEGKGGKNQEPQSKDYENKAGEEVTEACLSSIAKHLKGLVNYTIAAKQKLANQPNDPSVAVVESVHFYEMFDEPTKAPPEDRFGLMYHPAEPKVHLSLASAFSGGALSQTEIDDLTKDRIVTQRPLLTEQQIKDWLACRASP